MPKVYAFMSNFEQSQARLVYEQSRLSRSLPRSLVSPADLQFRASPTVTLLTQRLGALASAYNDVSSFAVYSEFCNFNSFPRF